MSAVSDVGGSREQSSDAATGRYTVILHSIYKFINQLLLKYNYFSVSILKANYSVKSNIIGNPVK